MASSSSCLDFARRCPNGGISSRLVRQQSDRGCNLDIMPSSVHGGDQQYFS